MIDRLRDLVDQMIDHLDAHSGAATREAPPHFASALDRNDEEAVRYRAIAAEQGLRYAEASELLTLLDAGLARRLDPELREKHRVVPVEIREAVLIVATDEPGRAKKRLRREYGVEELEYVMVTPTAFGRLQWAVGLAPGRTAAPRDDLLSHDVAAQPESVALLETILMEAAAERASDIHLENGVSTTRVRIRVDGDLRDIDHYEIDKARLNHMVRVAKVQGRLDIAETRRAQGGQLETVISGKTFFVRVQTQPTTHGENLILRLLPQDAKLQSLDLLGLSPVVQERYTRLLHNPGGLVLVVGPTGSGKTTTLYAGLRMLAEDVRRKVITVEDPVEYACEGVQQVEIARDVGFGFADAMRSFVRQDPDVILLGEVRDPETAREAIRASQTGHLVLTTLHCNDSVDAVQRLLDLGMSPNSISSELLAIFAQRLARRICEGCREEVQPDPEVVAEIFPNGVTEGFRAFAGRGCEQCGGVGGYGRIAVVEHLPMNASLRAAIAERAPVEVLRRLAREAGLVSMRERALELVESGTIAFDSLPRFIPLDRLVPPR